MLEANANPVVRVAIEHADFKNFTSETFSLEPGTSLEDLRFELELGGRLDVTVVDVNGSAVPDASVRVVRRSAEEGASGRSGRSTRKTGPEGQAALRGLDGGDYGVAVSKNGFQSFFSRATVFEEQVSQLAVRLLPENIVTGTVADRYGVPVENVWIRARAKPEEEGLSDQSSTRSDAAGTFRVGNLGQGPYTLEIRARDFVLQTLEEVEVNTRVPIVLEGLGGISGLVVAAGTGGPVTRFKVGFKKDGDGGGDASGGGWNRRRSREKSRAFNDPQGVFSLEELSPGDYVLEVTAVNYVGVEVRVTVRDSTVTEGVQVVLVEGLAVSGVVAVGGTGSPVAAAQIFLFPVDEISEQAEDVGSAAQRRGARREAQQNRRAGRREGNAGGEQDRLLAVVAATMLQAAQGGNALAETGDDGSFKLREMPYGEYVLLVNHDAFVPAHQNVYLGADGMAPSLRVDLERGESLEGTITLADGSAASGARVRVRSAEGIRKRVLADPGGRFLVSGLLPGEYFVSARTQVDGQKIKSRTVRLTVESGLNRFDYRMD